jgi:hypothetical protein
MGRAARRAASIAFSAAAFSKNSRMRPFAVSTKLYTDTKLFCCIAPAALELQFPIYSEI